MIQQVIKWLWCIRPDYCGNAAQAEIRARRGFLGVRGLWDGQSPIRIEDAHATYARIKDLDDEALGAMQLSEIVQVGTD